MHLRPAWLVVLVGALGCGSAGSSGFGGGDAGTDVTSSTHATSTDGGHKRGAEAGPILVNGSPVSVHITPANPTITVVNGAVGVGATFVAMGTSSTGVTSVAAGGSWTFDRPDLGTIDSTGKLTASGLAGGVGHVSVSVGGLSATTTATIVLQMTLDPDGFAATIGPKFAAATATDPLLSLDYPYDQTVFPLGLPAPIPQWCIGMPESGDGGVADGGPGACSGNATDVYDIKLTTATATFEAFTTTATPGAPPRAPARR